MEPYRQFGHHLGRKFSNEQIAEMEHLRYVKGMKWKGIAELFNTDEKSVIKQLQNHGTWEGGRPLKVPNVSGWDFSKENVEERIG